jgi:SRSO17 transposase
VDRQAVEESEKRFAAYIEEVTAVIGHADRAEPLKDYCRGLLAAEGRKSVEPMAALTAAAADEVPAHHQRLVHFVAASPWSDERVLGKVRELVVPVIEREGPIEAWIIDDTSFPKQGSHSVGVHHQYCGQLGKQANCQVAVTLSIANHHASLPIAYQLYLPEPWASDKARRRKARVPETIKFKTKPQIALAQLSAALKAGLPRGVVLMDGSYGSDSGLRAGISALGLSYIAAIVSTTKVRAVSKRGALKQRVSAKELALKLPKHAWRAIEWREGTAERLTSRFARVRVHTAPIRRAAERPEETLLIEWPEGAAEPTKYWLATVDENISFRDLVDLAKMRWRIERDYQDLKQEVGLGHYEGRGWVGFHHHATLCIAAYGFLISEQETVPPSGPRSGRMLKKSTISGHYRPRGAPDPAGTSRSKLDRNPASEVGGGDRSNLGEMSLLCTQLEAKNPPKFVTQ